MKSAAIWLIASSLLYLSASVGLSRLFENDDAVLAGRLFPFNTEAVVRETAAALNDRASGRQELAELDYRVRRAIGYDRIDSRLYSLLGEIAMRKGDGAAAADYFDQSARLARTDRLALTYSIRQSVGVGDMQTALSASDILLRRWPDQIRELMPVLMAILSEPGGYGALLARLSDNPPWREAFFAVAAGEPAAASGLEKLLLDLRAAGSLTATEISIALAGFMQRGRYGDAYRFFLFTLTDEQKKLGGYIFNSRFAPSSTNGPFDWRIGKHPGVEIDGGMVSGTPAGPGISLRFLGTPVKAAGLQQFVQMPPGDYALSLDASASALALPKGLFWTLRCVEGGSLVARLDVAAGSYERRLFRADVSIPPDCTMQALTLETGMVAESWRYRYSGRLALFELKAERVQSR